MTWWLRVCRAAWTRWDAWLDKRAAIDAETATWLGSLSTPEDLAEIGIADPVTRAHHRLNTFATKEEADSYVARYERDRCHCGGSPSWVDPAVQIHRSDCQRIGRHARPKDFEEAP